MDRRHVLAGTALALAFVAGALVLGSTKEKAASKGASGDAGEHPKEAESKHKDEAEHQELPKRVHLAPEVITAAKIETAPVTRELLETVLELPGEVAVDPDKMARVAPPLAGRIERVLFAEGKTVKARDLLAVIRVV